MNDRNDGPQVLRSSDGDVIGAAGNLDRYLLESAASSGRLAIVEHTLEPRVLAAPLHRHSREDEYSFVIGGTLGCSRRLGWSPLPAGTLSSSRADDGAPSGTPATISFACWRSSAPVD